MFCEFQGTKYELIKSTISLASLLNSIKEKLFEGKEPFLLHLLRKELGGRMRQNLRQNLKQDDVVIYSDFSKGNMVCVGFNYKTYFSELELTNPETLKNEGFGASHRTYQIIPQVDKI